MNLVEVDPSGRERTSLLVGAGGEHIYAETTGAGSPVVLCHGLGGNHAVWWRQVEPFAEHHQLVTWDQRGFGNSTSATGRVGITEAASDLGAVLDRLGIRRCHLVGQSMGGFVALRFALANPDRVRSLVLSTTLAAAPAAYTEKLRGAHPTRPLRDRHPVISDKFCSDHPDLVILYNQISSFGAKPPVAAMLDAMAATTFTDAELAQLAPPVLFLAAEHDHFCPAEVMATAAGRLTTASVEVIPGSAHSAYYEVPALWNSRVLSFINTIDTRSSDPSEAEG
ncbi:MAG TPA: alpha/beta hydrolase [Pseudonocardia sp.]|jgi:pimeloyl-ACP methyl ester carboxylesterase